ncbi:MAG: chromosome segregation protein SMC [Candidatus Micrarchaeia archaeon]
MGAYISKIKCRNFKSFRNLSMDLIRGFQALMGPNGSGKSNLTDAIRFALGEMKFSALRAKKISDLINHDSEYAEVTLVIDTPEGEITVQRRVNREGKSGYRLNGKSATRQSVMEVLKKYYIENGMHNVIGQGEVQKIIEMNPIERRKIIDEIAGVAEFDAKKNEAMKELDSVQQKINETRLILKEKEGYVNELGKERDVALKYLELKKAITNLRNSIIYHEIRKVEKEYEEVTRDYALKKTKISDVERAIDELNKKIAIEEEKIRSIFEVINKSATDNNAYREYERLMTNIAVLSEKKNMLLLKREELSKSLSEFIDKKSSFEKEVEDNAKIICDVSARLQELRKELDEVKKLHEMSRKRDSTLVNESVRLTEEISALEEEMYEKEKVANEVSLKASQIEYTLRKNRDEITKLEEYANRIEDKTSKEVEKEIKMLEEELERKRKLLEELFAKERKCNEENAEVEKQLLKCKDEYSKYRSITGHMQSEMVLNFVKELREKNAVHGIYGAVHELCSFDPKYSTAIEAAVGTRLNYIVVEDVDTSKEVIEYLRNRKIGRATFLPLNMNVQISKEKLNYPGIIGRLVDLIEYDPKFSALMEYVFGDTVLVMDIDTAKGVGLVGRTRLVTMDGDVIERTGAITGGYFVSSMRLGERKRAIELEERIQKLQERKEELINELYSLRDSAAQLRRERSEIEVRVKTLQIELESIGRNADEISMALEKIKMLKNENTGLEREQRVLGTEHEKISAHVSRLKERINAMRKRKMDIDTVLFKKEGGDNERLDTISSQISLLEGELKVREVQKDSLKKSIAELDIKIKTTERELDACNDSINESEVGIAQMEDDMKKKKAEMELVDRKMKELVKQRDELQLAVDKIAHEKGELERHKEKMLQELVKAETRKAILEQKLIDLKSESGNEEFELIEGNINKMKNELGEKEMQLQAIGNVNLLAPQMYDEKKREVEEISKKLEMLDKERESVISMINEVDGRKLSVFMESFEKVSSHFEKLFSQTFTSGSAKLMLQKPSNPFEGGLDIKIVHENGREERLEGLSGGEKSIITMLFVFAIHMHKPSAFYILDEVESALDKVRSRLIAELLKKLSQHTQFIVVSHNDTVISLADAVIGISKTDNGSQAVSIALNRSFAPSKKG